MPLCAKHGKKRDEQYLIHDTSTGYWSCKSGDECKPCLKDLQKRRSDAEGGSPVSSGGANVESKELGFGPLYGANSVTSWADEVDTEYPIVEDAVSITPTASTITKKLPYKVHHTGSSSSYSSSPTITSNQWSHRTHSQKQSSRNIEETIQSLVNKVTQLELALVATRRDLKNTTQELSRVSKTNKRLEQVLHEVLPEMSKFPQAQRLKLDTTRITSYHQHRLGPDSSRFDSSRRPGSDPTSARSQGASARSAATTASTSESELSFEYDPRDLEPCSPRSYGSPRASDYAETPREGDSPHYIAHTMIR